MKKLVLIITALFSILSESHAQYNPMLGDSTEWCIAWNFIAVRSGSYPMEFERYTATDTFYIDTLAYRKFYKDGTLIGAIYEDTATKKVYYRSATDTASVLLYDYSLNLGDTMVVDLHNNFMGNMNDGNYIVDSIGIDTIRGGPRKYIRLHNPLNTNLGPNGLPNKLEWIESVGDIHNTLYTYMYDDFGYGIGTWNCGNQHESAILKQEIDFAKNYVSICAASSVAGYVHPDTCQVDYAGNVGETKNPETLSLFPNPSNGNDLTIDVNGILLKKNMTVTICDETGRMVYSAMKNPAANSIKLDNLDLKNGIYFVTLLGDQTVIAKSKLVVAK
ncbi:MAG TPA: T9SS type A sorting domain-containing protein [Flavobacteriales bacterium]|nr:T9SS type A sorting domain-containing protein [Flavobacteriales bacterium]